MAAAELSKALSHLRSILVKQDTAGMTDGELLKRYLQQRDETAFEALVRRHGPMVFAVCRRVLRNLHDAEDAFQATFLVLVRKASSLRSPGRLGNWLYGVAYRTAQEARRAVLKRQAKEGKVVPRSGASENAWTDLRAVLDQELERLPEKYRTVVVLCGLEGATGKEAARQLAVPEGTVASRLARGRAMLAKRLAGQGLVLSSGSLAVMLSEDVASACLPTSLLVSTVKAAALFAAGQAATAGLISVEVAALTKGVLTTKFLSKLKVVMAVLVATVVLITGTGVMMSQAGSPAAQDQKPSGNSHDRSGRDAQEQGVASSPETAKEGARTIAKPEAVARAYRTNMALADEKFTGKRITVRGKMTVIRGTREWVAGNANNPQRIYYLDIASEGTDNHGIPFPFLRFRFTEDERKELAKLEAGQQVTIEGEPREPSPDDKGGAAPYIRLDNCKIINLDGVLPPRRQSPH